MALFNLSISRTLAPGHIPCWKPVLNKKEIRKPNEFSAIVTADNDITIGDEVKFYDLDNNYQFGGIVQKPKKETGALTLQISDYGIVLSQVSVSEVFSIGDTYVDIISYLINTYTDLTFVNNLTITTPTLTVPLVRRDTWLIDIINELLKIFDGSFTVDKDKNFSLFQINDNTSTSSLINGEDALIRPWETDNALKAEKVVVKGAIIEQRTTETLTGTGTVFNTTRIPENVEISGLTQTTSDINGDYEVDPQNKKITFESSQTDPVVSYTYQSQIRIEIGVGKTVTLEKKYISTRFEARKLAREYKAKFEDGAQSSKWIKSSSDIESFNVGDSINVIDEINNFNDDYIIQEVKLEYPNKMYITVGEEPDELFDWQKEANDRIKQLEERNNNSDFVTKDDFLIQDLNISVNAEITELKGIINDGTILWASETPLDTVADLISDDGPDEDYALAYDEGAIPSENIINYLN